MITRVLFFAAALVGCAFALPACPACTLACRGNCCPSTGECPSSSCVANGFGPNNVNCNNRQCPDQKCDISAFSSACEGAHCLGRVKCTEPGCDYEGQICFFDGTSDNFKICTSVQNCVVGPWEAWSTCIAGNKTRTRSVVTAAAFGGNVCPNLVETATCNPLLDASGCGRQVLVHFCDLNVTDTSTDCVLPNGLGVVNVPTIAGFTRMRFRINARGEYKA